MVQSQKDAHNKCKNYPKMSGQIKGTFHKRPPP